EPDGYYRYKIRSDVVSKLEAHGRASRGSLLVLMSAAQSWPCLLEKIEMDKISIRKTREGSIARLTSYSRRMGILAA
ncbi:MAG TPA: hypothetical protein VGO47_15030, partial [Chlamydiales bacterium]|nr:hypothetical protein [Chlamydiales bacterium]